MIFTKFRTLGCFALLVGTFLSFTGSLRADEGMWLLNDFPISKVKKSYGFSANPEWLSFVQRASVRLARGCSGSFISSNGLVLTNHHCALACIEQVSTSSNDYVKSGFLAKGRNEEPKCPDAEVNQLIHITDVTQQVNAATQSSVRDSKKNAGTSSPSFNDRLKAIFTRLEKQCVGDDAEKFRCDVVTLYQGGKYHLYKYRRYQDIRLVFAPEISVAFFGGDPDNFMFPRYDLDTSILRVYENGAPLVTPDYFKMSRQAKEGDLTFVTGHPGRTSRLMSVAELKFHRDYLLQDNLSYLSEMRGMLTEFQTRSAEAKRISEQRLFSVENGLKGLKGKYQALTRTALVDDKAKAEQLLRAKVKATPKLKPYESAWSEVEKVFKKYQSIYPAYLRLETSNLGSYLLGFARTLIRLSQETVKPNEERLREFVDSSLPAVKQSLFSEAPLYDELEIVSIAFSLGKIREILTPDHEIVKTLLGNESPLAVAERIVKGTKLRKIDLRKQLAGMSTQEILDFAKNENDEMLLYATKIEQYARPLRKQYEDEIEGPLKAANEKIAKARFAIQGMNTYPDATFTLRISYGKIEGLKENGKWISPLTNFQGLYQRHNGSPPFALPERWLNAKDKVDLSTAFNMATTNDIIGGNSGSPVINKDRELVGLIFDGNIHSLGGDFGYDPERNRAVAVHSAAILEALEKVYSARSLMSDLNSGEK